MSTKNIILVGVGGQGIILVSKILTTGLLKAGYDVKMSEVHGMAQRGGSVSTQVRYGEKVYSPIIGQGKADILVSFEAMEASRWAEYLKPEGKMIVNNYEIPSITIASGKAEYPKNVLESLAKTFDTKILDATAAAVEVGNIRTQNIVLLGALVKSFNLDEVNWDEVLKEVLPEKVYEVNLKAFKKGMELV